MNRVDIIVIIVLCICIILAYRIIKKVHCHNCSDCHKNCGGKKDGREFKDFIENQRDRID